MKGAAARAACVHYIISNKKSQCGCTDKMLKSLYEGETAAREGYEPLVAPDDDLSKDGLEALPAQIASNSPRTSISLRTYCGVIWLRPL